MEMKFRWLLLMMMMMMVIIEKARDANPKLRTARTPWRIKFRAEKRGKRRMGIS